jgi:hypothetical protein
MKRIQILVAAFVLSTVALFGCEKTKTDPETEFGGSDREQRIKNMEKNMPADQKAKPETNAK